MLGQLHRRLICHEYAPLPLFAPEPHKDVLTVDALSTIMLLMAIEAMYPAMRSIHVFLDNANTITRNWCSLASEAGCRIKLHFIPAYCRISIQSNDYGVDAQTRDPQQVLQHYKDFCTAMLTFLRDDVPETGALIAIRSRTTSASLTQRNSGLLREQGI